MTTVSLAANGNDPDTTIVAPSSTPAELGRHIESALCNPLQQVRLAASTTASGILREHEMRAYVVRFRTELGGDLERAWQTLNVMLAFQREHHRESHCARDRARARAIIQNIGEWIHKSLFSPHDYRDGYDFIFTIRVTTDVVEWLRELDELGRVLRMAVLEIGTPTTMGALVTIERAIELVRQTGAPHVPSAEWVNARGAATIVSLATETLGNRRLAGDKSADGLVGVDTDGRIWAKRRPGNSPTFYLRAYLSTQPSL